MCPIIWNYQHNYLLILDPVIKLADGVLKEKDLQQYNKLCFGPVNKFLRSNIFKSLKWSDAPSTINGRNQGETETSSDSFIPINIG